MSDERPAIGPAMVPFRELMIARSEIQRLQNHVEELQRKLLGERSEQRWGHSAAARDVARLKKAMVKAGIPVPPLLTDNPKKASGFEHLWRTTPNRAAVIKRDGIWCRYCGKKTTENTRQIDHVIPVARGGTSRLDNLAVCCKKCNYRKAAHLLEECGMKLLPPRGEGAPVAVEVSP